MSTYVDWSGREQEDPEMDAMRRPDFMIHLPPDVTPAEAARESAMMTGYLNLAIAARRVVHAKDKRERRHWTIYMERCLAELDAAAEGRLSPSSPARLGDYGEQLIRTW